jgi:hypothetical protein
MQNTLSKIQNFNFGDTGGGYICRLFMARKSNVKLFDQLDPFQVSVQDLDEKNNRATAPYFRYVLLIVKYIQWIKRRPTEMH